VGGITEQHIKKIQPMQDGCIFVLLKETVVRLDKFISESSDISRKEIKQLIKKKSVYVNGELALKPEMKVEETDEVIAGGVRIFYRKYVYLIFNKPQGCVSATEDKHYKVVTDYVPEEYVHYNVFPAGRLDIDTEGLLILTNDGDFVHRITSPKKNVYKRYFAVLDKPAEEKDIEAFDAGMEFKDFTAKPARLEICDNPKEAYVQIAEGKFHQVKRMFERVGKTVTYLRRDSIGGLSIPDNLELGEMVEISKDEIFAKIFGEM
jgi:16S rRNA pseudouridine516 synthase